MNRFIKCRAIFKSILDQANISIDHELNFSLSIEDPLGESVDLISYNEYFGWYYVTFFADEIMVSEGTLRQLMFEIMPKINISCLRVPSETIISSAKNVT